MSSTIVCLSEALSPITHAQGTAGNESLIAREPVMTRRGMIRVPFLSGNALRYKLVREPGILWLIERYDLAGKLSLAQLNSILHGGSVTQSTAREDLGLHADLGRLWPLLKLLGFCLPGQIFPGNLHVWRGTLVCEENRQSLAGLLDGMLPKERLRSAEAWIGDWQYTRNDASRRGLHQDVETEHASHMMLMTGQAVGKGAHFAHGFVVQTADPLQLGALLLSLRQWRADGGTIGGKASIGHGRLATVILANGIDQDALVESYVAHVDSVRDEAVAWLQRVFGREPLAAEAS